MRRSLIPAEENILLGHSSFAVRPNLYAALRYLRHRETDRIIFIDTICIDQSNNEERSITVRMMVEIYAHASQTLIWLGIATETDKYAFGLFREFEKSFEKHGFFHVDNTNDISGTFLTHSYEEMGLPSSDQIAWGAAATLF